MNKILKYACMAATALTVAACTEDYTDWNKTDLSYDPEPAVTVPGITASTIGSAIDLANAEGVVKLFDLDLSGLTEDMKLANMVITLAPVDAIKDGSVQKVSTADGTISADDLQELVKNAWGQRPVERTFNGNVVLNVMRDGSAMRVNAGDVVVKAVPLAPYISNSYWIVGAPSQWDVMCTSLPFKHSGADVYDDPVFTVTFPVSAGETWLAIADEKTHESGEWSALLGCAEGNGNNGMEGGIARRTEIGDDGSWKIVSDEDATVRMTINMMDYTYKIEMVTISQHYYIIGAPSQWDPAEVSLPFNHSSKDVMDDPVFSVVFPVAAGDTWFAVTDDITVAKNDWSYVFGCCEGNGQNGMEGRLARRSTLSDDGSWMFHADNDMYLKMTIDMGAGTYKLQALNFAEYIYEIGNESGWSTSHPLRSLNFDGKYQGYYYLDGEFKFKPNADNWDGDWEYVEDGKLTEAGGPNVPAVTGFYQIDVDLTDMSYNLTKVNVISIIGDFNGWSDDVDMTYNKEEGCWEAVATVNANGLKFRMNHDWSVSWGGSNGNPTAYDDLTQNGGKDLTFEAGTYKFKLYISYEGNNKVVAEKQ